MDQQKNYLVFQCYGNEGIFHECAYALLSLTRIYKGTLPPDTEVWIYTDNAAWFQAFNGVTLPLHFAHIDKDKITRWRGTIDFVHRVKIEMLKDFTRDKQGNVLYADTDVVFNRCLDDIFQAVAAGTLYMHVMEGY